MFVERSGDSGGSYTALRKAPPDDEYEDGRQLSLASTSRSSSRHIDAKLSGPVDTQRLSVSTRSQMISKIGFWGENSHHAEFHAEDMVMFSTVSHMVKESDGALSMDVIRFGSLKDECSVSYRSIDGSARAGYRYSPVDGKLVFGVGEAMKTIEVTILPSVFFDTTLSFYMELYHPENCRLDIFQNKIPVYILDNDLFPADALKAEIELGLGGDDDGLLSASHHLLYAFFKYTFNCVPKVWWKSLMILFLDQVRNVYYLSSIFMRVYLVDVILNVKDDATEEQLLVPGNRKMSTIMLAMAYTLPNFVLALMDRVVHTVLDTGFSIRKHLRVNLFRKYLSYAASSRSKVGIEDLTVAAASSIPVIVEDGYLGMFEMIKELGKICCMLIFIAHTHPHSILPTFFFPTAICIFVKLRESRQLHLWGRVSKGTSASQQMVCQAAKGFDIIRDYDQSADTVFTYQQLLKDQREVTRELAIHEFWNGQLVPWLTYAAIGVFLATGALTVLDGSISIGTFLATLNVYKDLGDKFGGVHKRVNAALDAIEPLVELTTMLNLPSELLVSLETNFERMAYVRKTMEAAKEEDFVDQSWNRLPIRFSDVSIPHVPAIQNFNAEVMAGSMVSIYGPSGCGKGHLLQTITGHVKPPTGSVLYAPYQRALYVCPEAEVVPYLNLLENLQFGSSAAPEHARGIFKGVSALPDEHWLIQQLDLEIANENGEQDWWKRLSHTEKKKIHISRALTSNPSILVLDKPLDGLHDDCALRILRMFWNFIQIGIDGQQPTIFISSATSHTRKMIANVAKYQWELAVPYRSETLTSSQHLVEYRSGNSGQSLFKKHFNHDPEGAAGLDAFYRKTMEKQISVSDVCESYS